MSLLYICIDHGGSLWTAKDEQEARWAASHHDVIVYDLAYGRWLAQDPINDQVEALPSIQEYLAP
jgi:hypothetical protein